MKPHHTLIPRLAAIALACGCASAQAGTLEGTLERGPAHSVLWAISPKSGDLIGQVFANTSTAGQIILATCLPELHCVAEGTTTVELPETRAGQLHFRDQPSGWWLIEQVGSAHMQPSLPMSERQLSTRHGQLAITEEHLLLFNGRPVAVAPPQTAEPAPQANPTPNTAPLTLQEKVRAWWRGWWSQARGKLLALLGRTLPQTPTAMPAPPPAAAEPVQGNSALHIVAHFALEGQDIVLLQDTGGTACPALYRFATLTPQGIDVTPEFGTCSDMSTVTLDQAQSGFPKPVVTMNGSRGPFEPEEEQRRAYMQLHRFVLRQGQVHEVPAHN